MMFVCSMTMFVLHMTMFVFMYDDVCLHYVYKWFGKVWLGLARLGCTRPLSDRLSSQFQNRASLVYVCNNVCLAHDDVCIYI